MVGTRWWQCQHGSVSSLPCPSQLQERYPDQPMELHLWARQQPLLSFRPDALHGTLFSSAEAFVVLPNATRFPAFLLNIVSGCCCHGSGSQGTPKGLAGAGVPVAMLGDTGGYWDQLGDAGLQALPWSLQHLFLLQDANVTGKPTISRNRLTGTVRLTGLVPDPELGLSSPGTYLESSPIPHLCPFASLSPVLLAQTSSCPQFVSVPAALAVGPHLDRLCWGPGPTMELCLSLPWDRTVPIPVPGCDPDLVLQAPCDTGGIKRGPSGGEWLCQGSQGEPWIPHHLGRRVWGESGVLWTPCMASLAGS